MEIIIPESKEAWLALRAKDITSTQVSALFGCSPYATEFEIWHQIKNGIIINIEENERMKWGTRLQTAIGEGLSEDDGIKVRPMPEYIRIPELRIGSSFDYSIEGDNPGILEIKNLDSLAFQRGWIEHDSGEIESPAHIELQLQHQLLVSGRSWGIIAALVGGNRLLKIRRDRNEDIINAIKNQVNRFWKSIDDNTPPKPDFERDAKFISSLYQYAHPGKEMSATSEIDLYALEYKEAAEAEREAARKKEVAKAKLLMKIGDNEKCYGTGYTITSGIVGPAEISYKREAYRSFRVAYKQKKEKQT